MRIGFVAAVLAVQVMQCVSAAPPASAKPKSREAVRETQNEDGTYTLELPPGRFKRVTDPQAFQGSPARKDNYDSDKYLTSGETEAGNRAIARQRAEQEADRIRGEEMQRDWDNKVKEAEDASRRLEAHPPSKEELSAEYKAAYERGYADAAHWVDTILRDAKRNAHRSVIEQEIDALNTVVATHATQHRKVQRYVDELVRAYGPEKRNKYALVLERTRGLYEGAQAAATRLKK